MNDIAKKVIAALLTIAWSINKSKDETLGMYDRMKAEIEWRN